LCLLSLGISFAKLRLPLSCVAQTDELSESEVLKADDASTQNLNQLEEAAKELVRFHEVSRNSTPKKHEKTTDYGRALYR